MKKMIIKIAILAIFLTTSIPQVWSQPPPPANHSETNNQVPGGGAPIGNGTLLLLSLAALYGVQKFYMIHNEEEA